MNSSQTKGIKIIAVTAAIICAVFAAIFYCSNKISRNLEEQLLYNLEDVSNQNALATYNQIHFYHMLLQSLSAELQQLPGNMADNVSLLRGFAETFGLKRLGFCDADGITTSTDGTKADLSFRDFFKRGMEGKYTITGVLADALSEAHGNVTVMTAPMYDDADNIIGVFGMTYDSDDFNNGLQVDCFNGRGCSCAINETGEIMVAMGSDSLQLSRNFFTDILALDARNTEAANNLHALMSASESGSGTFYINGENYYYCTPLSLMEGNITWYVLTIVPKNVLTTRLAPIKTTLYLMNFFVILFILIGILLLAALTRTQKRVVMQLAYEDPLTQGPNYANFCRRLEHTHIHNGCIVSMDISNFNNINIAAGKLAGDEMLQNTWHIISNALSDNEEAARVREDHFVLFLCTADNQLLLKRLETLSEHVHNLAMTYQVPGIHACFGIYRPESGETVDDAYSKAKMGREFAKLNPERHYAFYSDIDHKQLLQNQKLEERFDEALANHSFELWYQPKYSADKKELVGCEALVRWRDTDGSMISPGRFIPLFERNGSIARLDEYVFREACIQQKKWYKEGRRMYPISINLSRASLYYSGIVEKYQGILKEYDLNPHYIQLEVTESAIIGKENIAQLLESFRSMGIHILMDDFGTGYSSLSTLNMRCFDTLKLDKSLIDYIGDKNGETLLYYVIKMGRQLGLHITAEGVERSEQLEYLQQQKCDDIQGFFFAKPMAASDYEKLLL